MSKEEQKIILSLSVKERFGLTQLRPRLGSTFMFSTIKDVANRAKLTDEEKKKCQWQEPRPGRFAWNEGVIPEKEFELTTTEKNLLKRAVDILDEQNELPVDAHEVALKILAL